jgi:hypothetical protein
MLLGQRLLQMAMILCICARVGLYDGMSFSFQTSMIGNGDAKAGVGLCGVARIV